MPLIAFTRDVSDRFAECELTHLAREPIDLARARAQHAAYEAALRACGCEVRRLGALHQQPDAVFVEDTALVLDELAVITRPGAKSRRPETDSVAAALGPLRPLRFLEEPATLDGGDLLVLGRRVFVGLTTRSNAAAVAQLGEWLEPLGYAVRGVAVSGALHLKSAVTPLEAGTLLVNPAWVDSAVFGEPVVVEVHPAEPQAANALALGRRAILPAAFPRTAGRVAALGLEVVPVEVGELAKAEGGVTCCSLIVPAQTRTRPARRE
jgi:dimethylargininase